MTAPVFSENTRRDTPAPTTVYPPNTTKNGGNLNEKSESWQTCQKNKRLRLLTPGLDRLAPSLALFCALLALSRRPSCGLGLVLGASAASPCGLTGRTFPQPHAPCRAGGCARPSRNRGLCWKHYRRERASRPGTREGYDAGRAAPRWAGPNLASYGAAHERVMRERGAASLYACAMPGCHARAEQWALRPDAAHAATDATGTWSPEPEDYTSLCQPCHTAMDAATRAARKARTQPLPAEWARTPRAFDPPVRWTQPEPPEPAPPAQATMPATADLLDLLAKEE